MKLVEVNDSWDVDVPCDHVCERDEGLSGVVGERVAALRNWGDAITVESFCDGRDMILFLL